MLEYVEHPEPVAGTSEVLVELFGDHKKVWGITQRSCSDGSDERRLPCPDTIPRMPISATRLAGLVTLT